MKNNTKITAGVVLSLLETVLTLIGLIVYAVNINGAGYFKSASVTYLVPLLIAALVVSLIAAIAGIANRKNSAALDLVTGLCQIAAPVLLSVGLMLLISARIEGLSFIFFSNADVSKEVQTAENLSSAYMTIANAVIIGIAMLEGWIAAFFRSGRKAAKVKTAAA